MAADGRGDVPAPTPYGAATGGLSGPDAGAAGGEPVGEWVLDEESLVDWGEAIGRTAAPPLVLALSGDLGTGKTTLARAIARGAGVRGAIPSPTYNLLFRYPADRGIEVVHLDLYRLDQADDVWALGWADLPEAHELVVIEWPERAREYLPPSRWDVTLKMGRDEDHRLVALVRTGDPGAIPYPQPDERLLDSRAAGPVKGESAARQTGTARAGADGGE